MSKKELFIKKGYILKLFSWEEIVKIAKEIAGIKKYKNRKQKIIEIGARVILFFSLILMIFNNFFPFNSLDLAIRKILAENLKTINFYPQLTEKVANSLTFGEFIPEENFDFENTEFKEAKIKIYFSIENNSTPTQETGFLSEIKKFAERFFQKENKLIFAQDNNFSTENQNLISEIPAIEENESEIESPILEPPILENETTSVSPSNLETSISTDFITNTETQIENEASIETTTTENIEISTTTEITTKSEEKFSLWYNLGDEIWIKLSDISTTSENLEIEGQFLKSFEDVLNLSLKIEGENVSELKIEKVFVEVSFSEIKREEFEIIPLKKVFGAGERPIFEIREKGEEKEGVFEKILGSLKNPSETKIKIENSKREKFELKEEDFLAESHSPVKIEILNTENLRPGVNKIEVEFELDGQIYNLETNFVWGVLAINTSKSIYLPGDTAYFQMAALREDGHTLCDANLELEIETPKGELIKPEIQKSGECGPNNVTQKPDYFAFLKVNDLGTYKMKLKNLDREWEIEDFFEVREKVPFDIERIGPTRIYPPAKYAMKIKIKANEDFEGEIFERVPSSFEIIQDTKYEIRNTNPETKEIVWKTSLKENEEIELSYQFDAPDIAPYLYLLGPLSLKNKKGIFDSQFEEARQWQITSDNPADGSGACSVNPTSTIAESTGNTFTFTFTAAETMNSGELRIKVPSSKGWSVPQATSGIAGYTTATTTGNGMIGNVFYHQDAGWIEDDTDACNTATDGDLGLVVDGSIKVEGLGSILCNNTGSTGPDAGDSFGFHFPTRDLSSFSTLTFWIYSDVARSAGVLQAALDDNWSCDSPLAEINIPALTAGTWTQVSWNISSVSRTAVRTFCINDNSGSVGLDNAKIYIDDVRLDGIQLTSADFAHGDDDLDACNTAQDGDLGMDFDSVQKIEGLGALICNNTGSTGPDAGDSFGIDFPTSNWSNYTKISFWIYTTVATNATNYIQAALDDNWSCASPLATYNLTTLPANTWTYVVWDISSVSRTAVRSFCFVCQGTGCDSRIIYVDEILVGPGNLSFLPNNSDTDISARILQLANNESIIINYGNGGGSSGVTAPSVPGTYEFTTRNKVSVSGVLTNISSQPKIDVLIEISGKVYLDEGNNPSSSGSTVALAINSTKVATTTASTTDGSFSFYGLVNGTSTPITVFLDDSSEKGISITRYSGSGHLQNLDIFKDRIIVRHEDSGPISISNLDHFDSEQDSDILYTASSSAGTLETFENTEFFIWTTTTFEGWGQGIGNLSFSDLDMRGTFNATSNQEISVSCSGNFSGASCWQNLGNFFFASSTVKFTSTSTGKIINPGSSGFYNLEFNGSGGSWQFSSSTTIYGNLKITQGTLTGDKDITIKGGNLDCGLTCGDINLTGGTTTLEGTGNFGTSGLSFDWTFYNFVFGDGTNLATTTVYGNGTTTILNSFTINQNQSFLAGSKIFVLKFSGENFSVSGNFDPQSSTFYFEGTATTTIPAISFNNLIFNPSNSDVSFVFSSSSDVKGDFSIEQGQVFAPSLLKIGGDFINNGSFFHNNGKVIFNASALGKTINSGGTTTRKTFYDVDFDGAGGWQIENDILAERDFKIVSAGSFDASTTQILIEVRGDFKNLVGGNNTQWGNSTLYLNKTGGGEIEINPKSVSDNYGTLKLGQDVKVLLWNSFAQNFVLEEGAGFYSRNHQGINSLLYIEGNFEMTTGTEYWSYSRDFDGEEISGRQVIVQIASSSSFTLNGASLEISGTSSYPTIITNNGNGNFSFNLISGTFSANYYQFRNLDANGLNVTGTVNILSLDNGDFELAVNGGSLITVSPSIIEMGKKTFDSIRFATSTLATSGYNVRLTGSPSCSQSQCYWRFKNHFGGLDGENYDLDPGDQSPGWLQWDDSQYYTPRSQNWRWYQDEEKETPEYPLAEENVAPINIARGNALKLRITVKEISGNDGENIKFKLQYSTSSSFSWYEDVDEISCPNEKWWCYFDGGGNDNQIIATRLLSDSDASGTHNESGISSSSYLHLAGSSAEFEFTIFNNGAPNDETFYFRLFDVTNNQIVELNDGDFTFPSLISGEGILTFTISGLPAGTETEGIITDFETSATSTYFPELPFNEPKNAAQRLIISTNGEEGYQLFIYQRQILISQSGFSFPQASSTNEYPLNWSLACPEEFSGCYGYHTGDDTLSDIGLGSSRFAPDDTFAKLEETMKEIGYHPYPINDDTFDIIFRMEARNFQPAGTYQTEIVYILVPTF